MQLRKPLNKLTFCFDVIANLVSLRRILIKMITCPDYFGQVIAFYAYPSFIGLNLR